MKTHQRLKTFSVLYLVFGFFFFIAASAPALSKEGPIIKAVTVTNNTSLNVEIIGANLIIPGEVPNVT